MEKTAIRGTVTGILLAVSTLAISAGGLSKKEYASRYKLYGPSSVHWVDTQKCLSHFPEHPFKDKKNVRFRVIEPDIKIFGLGSNVADEVATDYPQFILIRPTVNVMSKTTYRLMNPNGWYCFKSKVNVMGKTVIKAACTTHITTVKGNTTVLGKSVGGKEGTTVMGKSIVERACD